MGRAAAIAYAREGADVAINYFPDEEPDAQEVIKLIKATGRVASPCLETCAKRPSAESSLLTLCRVSGDLISWSATRAVSKRTTLFWILRPSSSMRR